MSLRTRCVHMPAIVIESACSMTPETLLRFVIAGTGLRPRDATRAGVFEYAGMAESDRVVVNTRLASLRGRRLIVA